MRTRRSVLGLVVAVVAALTLVTTFAGAALAQAGHFVGTPTCTDIGTQVQCTGKVAGLGETTFTINVSAPGSCPNPMWTATVTDVQFTTATITLLEDSTVSDTITVPVT